MSTKLNLRIHSVKCVDETGGYWAEKFGDDEIYLGGFTVNTSNQTTKLNPVSIYGGFDDNEIQKYNPPKVFASFNLGPAFAKPKNYAVGFLLIEKDSGDMNGAVQRIYDILKQEIKKRLEAEQQRIEELSAPGAGTAVAAAIPIGLIWSVVQPYVYSYVKDKIVGWFGDEIFPLQDVQTTILSSNHTWHGKKTSPIAMVEFRGHGGQYQLFYDWELV